MLDTRRGDVSKESPIDRSIVPMDVPPTEFADGKYGSREGISKSTCLGSNVTSCVKLKVIT